MTRADDEIFLSHSLTIKLYSHSLLKFDDASFLRMRQIDLTPLRFARTIISLSFALAHFILSVYASRTYV